MRRGAQAGLRKAQGAREATGAGDRALGLPPDVLGGAKLGARLPGPASAKHPLARDQSGAGKIRRLGGDVHISEPQQGAHVHLLGDRGAWKPLKGIFAGLEESYTGRPKPFLIAALKTDTDEVYKTALTKGKGADYAKKNHDKNILFLLEATDRFPNPAMRKGFGRPV